MFHWTAAQAIRDVSILSVAGLAAWRGGWEARTVAFGMVAVYLAAVLFQSANDRHDLPLAELIVGIIYLVVVLWVALRSNRWWPLWTAAFQVVSVAIHLARMADPKIGASSEAVWSYPILIVIVVGVLTRPKTAHVAQARGSPSIGR